MKNEYIIEGDVVRIFLNRKNETLETLIDLDDFELANSYEGKYVASWYEEVHDYYARINVRDESKKSKYTNMRLHRIIMGLPDSKFVIDHINHNGLDNRKSNLRISLNKENTKHKKSKNKNNTSGYRNVTWDKQSEMWLVQLQVNGKNKGFGRFNDVTEAGKFAESKRKELYGDYAGEG